MPENGADFARLVRDNLSAAGDELVRAIRDQVDGLDDNPTLCAALAAFERATELQRRLK